MASKQSTPKNKLEAGKKPLRDYARYSSLGFKLIAVVLIGFFGGLKLDAVLKLEIPIFTLVLALSGLFLSLYLLIKELSK